MDPEEVVTPEGAEQDQVQEPAEEERTDDTAAEEEVAEETGEETPPPKPKQSYQERINELTRLRREAEREREYWRQAALQREKTAEPGLTGPGRVAQPSGPARPIISNFDSQEEYEDALLEWHDQRRTVQQQMTQQEREEAEAIRKFQANAKKIREAYEDFDEVIEAPVFTPAMRQVLLNSDNGPEVAYFLGRAENRDQAERIKSLPEKQQLYELGKLETQLLIAKKSQKPTKAPPPIKPVGTPSPTTKDPSEMNVEEWMAWNRKQEEERYKRLHGG